MVQAQMEMRVASTGTRGIGARQARRPVQLAALGLYKSYRKGRPATATGRGAGRWWLRPFRWRRRRDLIEVPVLCGLDLEVQTGQFLSIVGASGSGKSTLLHLLGTLDQPDQGSIYLQGRRIDNLPASERTRLRNHVFGYVFQFYHLLPELTAMENVLMPLLIRHGVSSYWRGRQRLQRQARQLLDRVGLGHRARHKPPELSGGEMQRAAIARALAAQPHILLADEPTGNLDAGTSSEIMELLLSLNRDQRLTIIMVTHDLGLAQQADRCLHLVDGVLK